MEKAAFIWDLDGTLLDSYGIIVSSLHKTYRKFGVELDRDDIHKEVIRSSVGDYISKLEKTTGLPANNIKEMVSENNDTEQLNIKPIKNAAEVLEYLKSRHIPSYVFTHKGRSTQTVLKNIGLYDFFDEIITGKDGFPRKPDPAAINYLIDKYNLEKACTFYVGDRSLDVECAANAGIKSILYLPENSPAKPTGKETFIVKDLLDIRKII